MTTQMFTFSLKRLRVIGADPFVPFTPSTLRRFVFLGLVLVMPPLPILVADLFLKQTNFVFFTEAFLTCYNTAWRFIIIGKNRKDFMNTYKTITDNFICANTQGDTELDKIFVDTHKLTSLMYRVYGICAVFAIVGYICKPIFFGRILPAAYDFKCDLENDTCFYGSWLYQCMSTAFIVSFMVWFDGIFFRLISFACIELKAIKYELIKLINDEVSQTDDALMKNLGRLVEHHNSVLDYIQSIDDLFRIFLFQQVSLSMAEICVALFQINLEGSNFTFSEWVQYATFLGGHYLQLFTYCATGEYLKDQTAAVANAAYSCNWHFKHLPKVTNGLIMIIRRSHRATNLTIGNVFDLNFELFASVCRSSFSVCALMQSMYEK